VFSNLHNFSTIPIPLQIVKMIHSVASLPLSSHHRVSQITFHPTQPYLAVQSHDRSVELFRIRTEEEVRKKQARRRKRAKEKRDTKGKGKADEDEKMEDENNQQIQLVDLFTPHLVVRASGKIRSFSFGHDEATAKGGVQVRAHSMD
jgi:U3 small nucleolar RNA-associated protein 12